MFFFRNLQTRTKILVGFFLVIILNFMIVGAAIHALTQAQRAALVIDSNLNHAFARVQVLQRAVQNLNLKFSQGLNPLDSNYSSDMLLRDIPKLIADVENAQAVLLDGLEQNVVSADSGHEEALLAQKELSNLLASSSLMLETLRQKVVPKVEQKSYSFATLLDVYTRDITPKVAAALESADSLIARQTAISLMVSSRLADPSNIYIIAALAGVTLIMTLGIAIYVATYIGSQVSHVSAYVERMAQGDFNFQIQWRSQDEFGKFRRSLQQMRDSVSHMVALTQQECAHLKDELQHINQAAAHIVDMSHDVQSQALTVSSASDEMVSATADIARNCESAASGSDQCQHKSTEVLKLLQRAFSNVQLQADHTQANAAQVETLATHSRNITSIVSTIDEVAAQTNLLALNAAIEAARAGSAGRGFAVVADEVRALAIRTAQSTSEISNMVDSIQKEAQATTSSIQSSVEHMGQVTQDAKDLEVLINTIAEHVNSVNAQVAQIASSTEEQTSATSEISAHAQSVTNSAQDMTAQATLQQGAIASTLNAIATLDQALSFFKLSQADYKNTEERSAATTTVNLSASVPANITNITANTAFGGIAAHFEDDSAESSSNAGLSGYGLVS